MKRKINAKFAVYYFCLQNLLHFSLISVYCVLSKMTVLLFYQLRLSLFVHDPQESREGSLGVLPGEDHGYMVVTHQLGAIPGLE